MKVFLLVVTTLVVATNAQSESKLFLVPSMPPMPSPGTGPGNGGSNDGNINNCPLDTRCPAVNPAKPVLLPNSVCTRFLKCEKGRACPYECPAGLHFNREKQVCDWPEQACCDPSVPCRPADSGNGNGNGNVPSPSPSPSLPPSWNPAPVPQPPVWNPSPPVPIPQPPTLTPRPPSAPIPQPPIWSPSPSVPVPQPPTLTPRPPSAPIPQPPIWNPSPPVQVPQPPRPPTAPIPQPPIWSPSPSVPMPPMPSPGTGPGNGGADDGNINNCPLDSRCPTVNPVKPVLLPNSVCTRFLKCNNGRACPYDCPPGLHFNREKQVCDWPEQACCDPSVPCRPADSGNGNGNVPSPSPSPSLPPTWNPAPVPQSPVWRPYAPVLQPPFMWR